LLVVGTQASPFTRVEHEMLKSIDRVSFYGLKLSVDYFIFNCLTFHAYQCFEKKIEKILNSNKYFFSLARLQSELYDSETLLFLPALKHSTQNFFGFLTFFHFKLVVDQREKKFNLHLIGPLSTSRLIQKIVFVKFTHKYKTTK
jgi:hypothetical protein